MTVEEIFAKISAHQIEGIMLHDQMAQYYDFLNLHGFKRLHEYHYFCESAERRGVLRYYINHFNALLPEGHPENPDAIPVSWLKYHRGDVDAGTKRKAIRDGFAAWKKWEEETKKLYEDSYCELCELGEVAAACKVKCLVSDADCELKKAYRLCLTLESVDYDMCTIALWQDEMHDNYKEKTKEIGIDIC